MYNSFWLRAIAPAVFAILWLGAPDLSEAAVVRLDGDSAYRLHQLQLLESSELSQVAMEAMADSRYEEARAICQRAWEEEEDPAAAFLLGLMYQDGLGLDADLAQAGLWYSLGAEAGHVPSRVNRARLLLEQEGDRSFAVNELLAVAEESPLVAGNLLAWISLLGIESEPDARSAAMWWRRSAEAGNAAAYRSLASLYLGEYGFPSLRDETRAREYLEAAAESGDVISQITLAQAIGRELASARAQGEDIDQELAQRALDLLDKACAAGSAQAWTLKGRWQLEGSAPFHGADPIAARSSFVSAGEFGPALFMLGQMLEAGQVGEGAQPQEAMRRYRLAGEQGHGPSLRRLGLMTLEGSGELPPQPEEGLVLLLDAAGRGDLIAQTEVGRCYLSGRGCRRDWVAARAWLVRAAQSNNPEGQVLLAEMLLRGWGGEADSQAAAQLAQNAWNRARHPSAAWLLGLMLASEPGQERAPMAVAFLRLADEEGVEDAGQALKALVDRLDRAQRQQAEEFYSQLRSK